MTFAIGGTDLAVLAAYLVTVVMLGVWVGRGQRNLAQYLLGGRDLPWWSILGSIVATETSTATFLSVPGLAFAANTGDMRFLQLALGYVVGRCLIVHLLLPLYFRGELFTAYEVLEQRFGGATKRTASIIFLVTRNLGDGLRLYLTAIVLVEIVRLPLPVCVGVIGVITIAYTFIGGMKAVVWNDCLQFVVHMVGGLVTWVFIIGGKLPGGWDQFVAFGAEHDKFRVLDFRWNLTDPYTFWAGLIGGMFLTLGTHGTDQMMVQRYLCARSQRDAGRALMLSGVVVLLQFAFFLLLGVALAGFYDQYPPEVPFRKTDRVFASFIVNELPWNIGVVGLMLAAVFSAAMSTLSSSLNSSAASLLNDIYLPLARTALKPQGQLWASRWLTVAFGVIQIGIGVAAQYLNDAVVNNALAIASFSAGLLLGVFFLGIASEIPQGSALFGLLCGLIVLSTVKFATSLAWPWLAIVGAATTFGCGLAAGMWFNKRESFP